METYDVFVGIDWIAETRSRKPIGMAIVPSSGRPWLRVPCESRRSDLFGEAETHVIKVINLRSDVIPAQRGMMFRHANSIGAAFVLLILDTGLNLGVAAWLFREYGFKRGATWMTLLLSIVLGLAYSVDQPLFPKDIEPANHTHAFDIYCQPFSGPQTSSYLDATKLKLQRDISPFEWRPLWLFGLLILSGVVLSVFDRSRKIEQWLESALPRQLSGRGDMIVPGPILGVLSLAGLVAFSIVGCFAWYPAPDECLEAMTDSRVAALSAALSLDHKETKYWAERYDDWTRKLEVGAWLRNRELSDYHRWKARLLREHLEVLEHEVEDGEREEVNRLVAKISRVHLRMRRAFTEEF